MEVNHKTNIVAGLSPEDLDSSISDALVTEDWGGLQDAIKNLKNRDQLSVDFEGDFTLLQKIKFSARAGVLIELDLEKYKMIFNGKILGSVAGDVWQKGGVVKLEAGPQMSQGVDAEVEMRLDSPEEVQKVLENIQKLPTAQELEFILSHVSSLKFEGHVGGGISARVATLLDFSPLDSKLEMDLATSLGGGLHQGVKVEFENKKPVAIVQETQISGSLQGDHKMVAPLQYTGTFSVQHRYPLPNVFKSHEQNWEFVLNTHDAQKKSGTESRVSIQADAVEEIYRSGFFKELLDGDYDAAFAALDKNGIQYDKEERRYEHKSTAENYSLKTFLNSSVSSGMIVNKSPTMP